MSGIDKHEARTLVATRVASLHDDTLIGPQELAALISSTWQNVQKVAKRDPGRLPPRAAVPGRLLRWHLGTVRAWIRNHSTTAVTGPARRVGAPRK